MLQGPGQMHAWGWVGRRLWRPAMALRASLLCTMGMVSSASSSSDSCKQSPEASRRSACHVTLVQNYIANQSLEVDGDLKSWLKLQLLWVYRSWNTCKNFALYLKSIIVSSLLDQALCCIMITLLSTLKRCVWKVNSLQKPSTRACPPQGLGSVAHDDCVFLRVKAFLQQHTKVHHKPRSHPTHEIDLPQQIAGKLPRHSRELWGGKHLSKPPSMLFCSWCKDFR